MLVLLWAFYFIALYYVSVCHQSIIVLLYMLPSGRESAPLLLYLNKKSVFIPSDELLTNSAKVSLPNKNPANVELLHV